MGLLDEPDSGEAATDNQDRNGAAAANALTTEQLHELIDRDPVIARYLVTTLARTVLARRPLALGFYAEHLVAHLIDGRVMDDGMAPWDVELDQFSATNPNITIQVKATTGTTFNVSPAHRRVDGQRLVGRWSDVYVLARHLGDGYSQGWVFYVVPTTWLDQRDRNSISVKGLEVMGARPTEPSDLRTAIVAIVRDRPVPNVPTPERRTAEPAGYNGFSKAERTSSAEVVFLRVEQQKSWPLVPCEICGMEPGLTARGALRVRPHGEDYDDPRGYRCLCNGCHQAVHKRFRNPTAWRLRLERCRAAGHDPASWAWQLKLNRVDLRSEAPRSRITVENGATWDAWTHDRRGRLRLERHGH